MKKIFVCGESYIGYTVHVKGADSMTTTGYFENVGWLKHALEEAGYEVTYMPSHEALAHFRTQWKNSVSMIWLFYPMWGPTP